jgi:hypothetical protein
MRTGSAGIIDDVVPHCRIGFTSRMHASDSMPEQRCS